MRNRDLGLVMAAFVALGFAGGAFVLLRHGKPALPPSVPDAAVSDEPTPLPPLDPEPDPEDLETSDAKATPVASAEGGRAAPTSDAGPQRLAGHDAGTPTVVHAQNLLIHPVGHPHMCIDFATKKHALHLYTCHGKKNQRWTAAEDVGGAIRLTSGQGGCVVVAGTTDEGEPALTLAECTTSASRFLHFEDHKLQEVGTGKCVTVHRFERGTWIGLSTCDSSPGQLWVLGE